MAFTKGVSNNLVWFNGLGFTVKLDPYLALFSSSKSDNRTDFCTMVLVAKLSSTLNFKVVQSFE